MVVFSGGIGYLLAQKGGYDWGLFIIFCVGSFLITASANTINQLIEIESDKVMTRTQNRPLPSGRLTVTEAFLFAAVCSIVGFFA